jgi:hypothetical protein
VRAYPWVDRCQILAEDMLDFLFWLERLEKLAESLVSGCRVEVRWRPLKERAAP